MSKKKASLSVVPENIAHQEPEQPEFKSLIPQGVPLNLAFSTDPDYTRVNLFLVTNNFEGTAITLDRNGLFEVTQKFLEIRSRMMDMIQIELQKSEAASKAKKVRVKKAEKAKKAKVKSKAAVKKGKK